MKGPLPYIPPVEVNDGRETGQSLLPESACKRGFANSNVSVIQLNP